MTDPGVDQDGWDVTVSTLNFEDIIFSVDNSIAISPNRYAGVTFSASGSQTWLTRLCSLSYPNSLIVGYSGGFDYNIYYVASLVIDFSQASKNVAFWWGPDGTYSSGTIEIYNESYQLVNSLPVSLFGSWVSFALNLYSQRIKRIILRRPAISNNLYGHIYRSFWYTRAGRLRRWRENWYCCLAK